MLLAARHATVTKSPETEWEMLKPNVELVISQFFDIPNVKPVSAVSSNCLAVDFPIIRLLLIPLSTPKRARTSTMTMSSKAFMRY